MSRVRTNQITNSAGTGAPNFPNGVTVTGVSTVTGNFQAGGNPISGAAQGTLMGSFGGFNATRTTSNNSVFVGYTEGDSTAKVDILADGSATLAKTLTLNSGSTATGTQFSINKSGGGYGAYFYNDGNSTALYLNGSDALANITLVGNDGSGVFDGNVRSNEGFVVYPPLDSNYAFSTRNAADNTWTAFIEANGSATFAGSVKIGGSAAANQIDEYETGSFNATCSNGVTVNTSTTTMQYVRIGDLVHVQGQIRVLSSNTNQALEINNLPFTVNNIAQAGGDAAGSVRVYNGGIQGSAIYCVCAVSPGTLKLQFYEVRDNATSQLLLSTDGAYYMVGITYMTT